MQVFEVDVAEVSRSPDRAQERVLRAGELIFFRYIPRGCTEPEDYPAVVFFEHDGQVSFTVAEIIDGAPRARQGRTKSQYVKPRNIPHALDYVAQALLIQLKDHRKMALHKESIISSNRVAMLSRKTAERGTMAASTARKMTTTNRRRF